MRLRRHSARRLGLLTLFVVVGCNEASTSPASISLVVDQAELVVLPGTSKQLNAWLAASGDFIGGATFTVTNIPTGIGVGISVPQTSGSVTYARITISASYDAPPGFYNLAVNGHGIGVSNVTSLIPLEIPQRPVDCTGYDYCGQWGWRATASSQRGSTDWSAGQALGAPDVEGCREDPRAWSPADVTTGWLEVEYVIPVRPLQVRAYESSAPGGIVKVELRDTTGTYHSVYTAQAQLVDCPRVLTINMDTVERVVNAVRISVGQVSTGRRTEIDAVHLSGLR